MNLIIHDLSQTEWNLLNVEQKENVRVIDSTWNIGFCKGCFACWLKTPGKCVLADDLQNIGELLAGTEQLLLISRCTYGGYSSFVKKVMERMVCYLLSSMKLVDQKISQENVHKNHLQLKVIFYGDAITGGEKDAAWDLVYANAQDYKAETVELSFAGSIDEIREALG